MIALLGFIPAVSIAVLWDEFAAGSRFVDPHVEVRRVSDRVVSTVATFGPRVGRGADAEYSHTFQLRNDRSEEIIVDRTSKSCSCLSGEIDRTRIAPGDAASVMLKVRPSNLINNKGSFTVYSESGEQYFYELRTWTYPPVTLEHDSSALLSFGLLSPGSRTSTTRRLLVHSYAGTEPPKLRWVPPEEDSGVVCTLTDLGVEPFSEGRLLRRVYDLKVEVATDKTPGLQMREITFKSIETGDDEHELSARVTWNVGSPITVDPPRWILKRSDGLPDKPMTKTIRLQGGDGLPFRVTRIECSHDALSAAPVSGDATSATQELAVTLDARHLPLQGPFVGTVFIDLESDAGDRSFAVSETFRVIVTD